MTEGQPDLAEPKQAVALSAVFPSPHAAVEEPVEELFDSRQSRDRFLFNLVTAASFVITRRLDSPGSIRWKTKISSARSVVIP
jgi:hypothetical protein